MRRCISLNYTPEQRVAPQAVGTLRTYGMYQVYSLDQHFNPSMHIRRQADDGFRACAGPGGTGLRMDCGGDLRWRHHLRRWCKVTSSWRALGSTTCSSPGWLKSMLLRSHRTTFQITLKGAAACLLLAPVVFPIGTDAIPVLKPAPSRPHTLLTPDPCAPSRRTHPLREVTHFVGRGRSELGGPLQRPKIGGRGSRRRL